MATRQLHKLRKQEQTAPGPVPANSPDVLPRNQTLVIITAG